MKAGYSKPQPDCVDLAFYKHLLCEIFKGHPDTWPDSMKYMKEDKGDQNEPDHIKLWKDLRKFKQKACDKYDINLQAFANEGVEYDVVNDERLLEDISDTIQSLTNRIWTWPDAKSRSTYLNGNKINVAGFYYQISIFRCQLLRSVLISHQFEKEALVEEAKKGLIKAHQEEVKLLQKLTLPGIQSDGVLQEDLVSEILNSDSKNGIKLFAALNAICNNFIRLPVSGNDFADFFNKEPSKINLGYSSLVAISEFMKKTRMNNMGSPYIEIYNFVQHCTGTKPTASVPVLSTVSQPGTPGVNGRNEREAPSSSSKVLPSSSGSDQAGKDSPKDKRKDSDSSNSQRNSPPSQAGSSTSAVKAERTPPPGVKI